jgi:hypothetical protein
MRWRILKLDWSYAIGELIIVTAGVLIALALNQWISDRQLEAEEIKLLQAVREEFHGNIARLDQQMAYRKVVTESVNRLFELSAEPTFGKGKEIDKLVGDLVWWYEAEFATGAVENILLGGKLAVIKNPEIAAFLGGWRDELHAIKRLELQDYETFRSTLMPYLYRNANMPQISNTLSTLPGTQREMSPWSFPSGTERDHSALLQDPEFLAIMVHKSWDQSDVMNRYTELRPRMIKFIDLLDRELQR